MSLHVLIVVLCALAAACCMFVVFLGRRIEARNARRLRRLHDRHANERLNPYADILKQGS